MLVARLLLGCCSVVLSSPPRTPTGKSKNQPQQLTSAQRRETRRPRRSQPRERHESPSTLLPEGDLNPSRSILENNLHDLPFIRLELFRYNIVFQRIGCQNHDKLPGAVVRRDVQLLHLRIFLNFATDVDKRVKLCDAMSPIVAPGAALNLVLYPSASARTSMAASISSAAMSVERELEVLDQV